MSSGLKQRDEKMKNVKGERRKKGGERKKRNKKGGSKMR
jgi:hypothetical protein